MTRLRNIAMTRILEHCDERAWSILIKGDKDLVMIWAENFVMTGVMEHCDEKCHGTLC